MGSQGVDSRRRVLVVAQDFPWPAVTGSLLRLSNVVSALSRIGAVDLFSFVHPNREDACELPAHPAVARATTATYHAEPFTPRRRVRWALSTVPLQLALTDFSEPDTVFKSWVRPPYDVVWFSRAHTYAALGRPRLGPTVVDLDDLEDHKIRARLAAPGTNGSRGGSSRRGSAHARIARWQALLDARRWRALQQSVVQLVETVTVCSREDADRLAASNVTIVPNGYEAPDQPAGRSHVAGPPTVLFAGFLLYPANVDGACWLADAVLPQLSRLVPDVKLRLVGASVPVVDALHDPPRVTVVGRVPSMQTELARADVVAVPVRFGSGTRIKILEAFAHRIPVVSTTLGAEGLEAENERHLLIADTPAAFAAACARLLQDNALRRRLVDEAQRLYLARHQWSHAQLIIENLAEQHLAPASVGR